MSILAHLHERQPFDTWHIKAFSIVRYFNTCFFPCPVQEGLSLVKHGVSPYSGDVVHEVRFCNLLEDFFGRLRHPKIPKKSEDVPKVSKDSKLFPVSLCLKSPKAALSSGLFP